MEGHHAEAKEEEGSPMVVRPKAKLPQAPARRLLQVALPFLLLALFLLLACLALMCSLLALKVNELVGKVNSMRPLEARVAALQQDSANLQQEALTLRRETASLREQLRSQSRMGMELQATPSAEEMEQSKKALRTELLRLMPNKSSSESLLLQQKLQKEIAALWQSMPSDSLDQVARLLLRQTTSGGLVSEPRRLATLKLSLRALLEGVEGDFFEAGVYNGGTAVLMARVLAIYAPLRVLWAADSFVGLPKESQFGNTVAGSGGVAGAAATARLGGRGQYASARGVFEANLRNFKLDKGNVKILQGWFKDTLPKAPVKKIAFLRADGDIYDSTRDTLEALYGKLSLGGFVYFDDYGSFLGCRKAVDEFRARNNVSEPMMPVYENAKSGVYEAVWWQKRRKLRGEAESPLLPAPSPVLFKWTAGQNATGRNGSAGQNGTKTAGWNATRAAGRSATKTAGRKATR